MKNTEDINNFLEDLLETVFVKYFPTLAFVGILLLSIIFIALCVCTYQISGRQEQCSGDRIAPIVKQDQNRRSE